LKVKLDGQRGFPDRLIVLPGGRVAFVELKRPGGGVVSVQQTLWINILTTLGHKAIVSDSLEEVIAALA
jgi:hypothetical protein